MNDDILLEVKGLTKEFNIGHNVKLRAVDQVSFKIPRGKTLGVVGESGCGKSTLGKTIIHLYEPTSGQILFEGKDITHLNQKGREALSNDIQMIFQDPYSSLDPRMTVGDIVCEGLMIHKKVSKKDCHKKAVELLNMVGLSEEHASRFANEFSGGQRQRIGIARALSMEPKLIICDEPISALDVSIQAQVVNLLNKLQRELNLTYLFIAHDLSMVKHISDDILVMYSGQMVETGGSEEIYESPLHPYTEALFSANPSPDPDYEEKHHRILLEGDVPSPIGIKEECRFASRCSKSCEICRHSRPIMKEMKKGHYVACHLYDDRTAE